MVVALPVEPLVVNSWPIHRVGNSLHLVCGFDQIPHPWDIRERERGERLGSVGTLLVRQAGRQVLFELWDLVRISIILSLGPLGHLLDAFPRVQIVIDTESSGIK